MLKEVIMSITARQYAEARIAWLYTWDSGIYYKYMGILEATTELLDTQLQGLVDALVSWRSQWSVSKIESLLTMLHQGKSLGVEVGTFDTTFSINGFLDYLRTIPSNYTYSVISELDPTNAELTWWINRINSDGSDKSNIDALESVIHSASSHFVYTAIYRPNHIVPPTMDNSLKADILFNRGYSKLYQVLNLSVSIPDY